MSENIDTEIEAIKTILTSLESLEEDVRRNVVEYILKRIKFDFSAVSKQEQSSSNDVNRLGNFTQPLQNLGGESEIHIKQFKESKSPKSDIEMAAIVAYYLQYYATANDKKDKIGTSDLETWFKIADYPLPKGDMKFLLVNTKNAGYFDSVGSGEYKLNAVGYNLVKHNLPKGDKQSTTKKTRKSVKKVAKKVAKKASQKPVKKQ